MIAANRSIPRAPSHGVRFNFAFSFVLVCGLLSSFAQAQLFDRALVIKNARILGSDGSVGERASIMIKGDTIAEIGPDLSPPFLSSVVDAEGKTVTPGLIDAWSSLGRFGLGNEMSATQMAWDSFDRYNRTAYREALRHGVTAVYVSPGHRPGINGQGAVVKLAPDAAGSAGVLLDGEAALGIGFGSDQPATRRAKTFDDIRKQFRKALDYRQSLEDYEEDLKEYLKKLEERKDAEAKKEASNGKDGEVEEEDNEKGKEGQDKTSRRETSANNAVGSSVAAHFGPVDQPLLNSEDDGETGGESTEKEEDGEKENEEEEIKKPVQPKHDPGSEVLLRTIDHELPVRIEAQRSSDILNALALADEFNLDIVIEGGSEAYLLADKLAERKTVVVLGSVSRPLLFESNGYQRHSAQTASILQEAGAAWTIGSGAQNPFSARFVGLNAQLAQGHSSGTISWLQAVTEQAAKVLQHSGSIGHLAVGMDADFVIWDGMPGDPSARVERVYVNGKLAYAARDGGK